MMKYLSILMTWKTFLRLLMMDMVAKLKWEVLMDWQPLVVLVGVAMVCMVYSKLWCFHFELAPISNQICNDLLFCKLLHSQILQVLGLNPV